MCDHSGLAFGRVSGWPHWLARTKSPELTKAVLETSAYYDAVNFARKFKGKSLHGVGFIDTTCAPTTVYAAYNVHPEPKSMIASPLMGHGTDPLWLEARRVLEGQHEACPAGKLGETGRTFPRGTDWAYRFTNHLRNQGVSGSSKEPLHGQGKGENLRRG